MGPEYRLESGILLFPPATGGVGDYCTADLTGRLSFFLILAVRQMDILIAFTLHHLALYSYFTERIRVFEKLSSVHGSL